MPTQITPYTTTPSRQSPATFSADRDIRLAEEVTRIAQMNAMSVELNGLAVANFATTVSTSTTSLAIALGTKSLTVDVSKSYQPGMTVKIARTASPSNWMQGEVISYNSGTGALVVNATSILGSGTYTDWTITFAVLAGADGASAWKQTAATFTATPASTSTLTMTADLTANIKVGMSLRYVIGGTTYYGGVAAITSILLTVNGAPLSGDVTALAYDGGVLRYIGVQIPGTYEDASNTELIASDLKSNALKSWKLPKSYLIGFSVYSLTHDSGAHGQASARINGVEVNTTAGGLTIAANATVYSTVVDIATAAYDVNPGETIEITAVKGGNGDATYLTVEMIILTP
jgi:hypothetical protein